MNENKKNYLNKLLQDSNLEMQNNRFDLSLIKLQQILDEVPENSAILNLISVCYSNLDQYEKSIKLISKAIKLSPQEIGYYINKGNIYKKINKYKDAEKVYLEALKINGESPELLYNIGLLYSDEHNYKTAIDYYLKSLKLNPTNKYALNNLGTAFKELNKYEEAKKNYLDAISLDSFFSDAQFNLSLIMLAYNNSDPIAWEKYEYRNILTDRYQKILNNKIKKWNGEDLKNKSIIVFTEQGIGDTIQFARYIKLIKKNNTKIIFYTAESLKHLFVEIPEVDNIITDINNNFRADFYISLMSLPYIFRENNKIEKANNYLNISVSKIEYWKSKLDNNGIKKIGISWKGGESNTDDYKRSIPLVKFSQLFKLENCQFFSLQKDYTLEEEKVLKVNKITNFFSEDIDLLSFEDSSAIINNLDLVICIDSSIAHLSLTIGIETFLLLPLVADFRWGLKKNTTNWYKNAKLFRQKNINEWDNPINQILNLLKKQ